MPGDWPIKCRIIQSAAQLTGDKQYEGFVARHPEASFHQPEITILARERRFCKEIIKYFFHRLSESR